MNKEKKIVPAPAPAPADTKQAFSILTDFVMKSLQNQQVDPLASEHILNCLRKIEAELK